MTILNDKMKPITAAVGTAFVASLATGVIQGLTVVDDSIGGHEMPMNARLTLQGRGGTPERKTLRLLQNRIR